MPRESDALSAAIAATDAEMVAEIFSTTAVHDDTGDRSLEQQDDGLEGRVEDVDDGTEIETEVSAEDADGDGKTEVEAKDGEADKPERDAEGKFAKKDDPDPAAKDGEADPSKHPPPGRLRETTARAKAAEAERDALKAAREEDRRDREALKAQLDMLARQFASRQAADQPKPAKPEPVARPDKFADPEGYDLWVENQIAAARNETREDFTKRLVNMNLANTREVHKEKFDAAYQAILTAAEAEPEARIAIQKIWHSDNPGGELMRWHRDRETLREVNGDPQSYRQKIIDETRAALLADPEFRKEYLASIKADATGANGNGAPRHVIRVPGKTIPSLNGASGSALERAASFGSQSDNELIDEIFNTPAR